MERFKELLEKIKVPTLESDTFQNILKKRLIDHYFSIEIKYKQRLRFAVGFASLLFIFLIAAIIKPSIIYDINQFAFHKQNDENTEQIAQKSDFYSVDDFMKTTSIYNPMLENMVNPVNYQEDKAFIIRKYSSGKNEKLTIVSEFESLNKKPRKITLDGIY